MSKTSTLPWILVVTHGNFGQELVKSCEMIVGKMKDVYCFSLIADMAPEQLYEKIAQTLKDAPTGSIILTDIYGGTPSNVSAIFAKKYQYPVISGISLPILIEADMSRDELQGNELSGRIFETGVQGIKNITQIVNERG
ncbi:PTS sugar transporter subunit IIA [Zophobihabitans entericus]|uniref:PTS sugar transporter subunit IIA n=1 Tax=Zophobihabitans entericus TaxID=1635327 RepID=A0A6G9IBT5_9GAMM|nr:PTS sugar transporter subunit IIA [Zophobihabitans entericus]QIQ21696.1 PTS sugar transporter subunit IIA [Zophobihabitans entericus]